MEGTTNWDKKGEHTNRSMKKQKGKAKFGKLRFLTGTTDYLLEFHIMQISDYALKRNMRRSCQILETSGSIVIG